MQLQTQSPRLVLPSRRCVVLVRAKGFGFGSKTATGKNKLSCPCGSGKIYSVRYLYVCLPCISSACIVHACHMGQVSLRHVLQLCITNALQRALLQSCCKKLHDSANGAYLIKPQTAEECLRARFSAYAVKVGRPHDKQLCYALS